MSTPIPILDYLDEVCLVFDFFPVNFKINYPFRYLVLRDVQELKRDLDVVLSQYINFVKPSFEEFCLPVRKFFSQLN